jgi:hypothetical protein
MPTILIHSAQEKSHRNITDNQTITMDGGAGTVELK